MRNENEINFIYKDVTLQKVLASQVLMTLDFPEMAIAQEVTLVLDFSMRNLNDQPIKILAVAKLPVSVARAYDDLVDDL